MPQEKGTGKGSSNKQRASSKKRNTTSFEPSHAPPTLRLVVGSGRATTLGRPHSVRDVVLVPELCCAVDDHTVYDRLLAELKATGKEAQGLWASWHNDSHVIANDNKVCDPGLLRPYQPQHAVAPTLSTCSGHLGGVS